MISSALLVLLLTGAHSAFSSHCKCIPSDPCWPSSVAWQSLNASVQGNLIHNYPIAAPCYPGGSVGSDISTCEQISKAWSNPSFIASQPLGYFYPVANTCPPINTTISAYPECDLGVGPVYTINATDAQDVAAGIRFARDNNVRLVVKNTGHDIVGRSQGYGSLMIWIKYLQDGIQHQQHYTPSDGCFASNWTGPAFSIHGGYVWQDAYTAAAARGLRVVGGDDPSVGVIGGYLQGGGHSPSSHDFGLGTDQVLEMKVILASGELVTASPCQNADLFTALRGGGGGTFGVVLSATIKAFPTAQILKNSLSIVPLSKNLTSLVEATSILLSKIPNISDAGFSGYGVVGQGQFVDARITAEGAYGHSMAKTISDTNSTASIAEAKSHFDKELLAHLQPFNRTSLLISSTWDVFSSFESYRNTTSGSAAAGGTADIIMLSRLFDSSSMGNGTNMAKMLRTLFSSPDAPLDINMDSTLLELMFIGGGQVLEPKPYTAVNPVWRKSYLLAELLQSWPGGTSSERVQEIRDDVTFRKGGAMRDVTPGMGTYLNEADRNSPTWKQDYYGENYDWLQEAKTKYDPDEVFWCWQCVGSEKWLERKEERGYGPLCRA